MRSRQNSKTTDLRITSGKYKGQRLRSPESALTHPMGAREKLALFNMLQPYCIASAADATDSIASDVNIDTFPASPGASPVRGPRVLDLYAGSGALGIEALSRGAREVVFVEKSPRTAHLISENLDALDLLAKPSTNAKAVPAARDTPATKVLATSVVDFCQQANYLSYFDVIIADPPYDNFHPEDLSSISQILTPNGVLMLSSPAKVEPPELPDLKQETTRTYAAARLSLYRKA